MTEPVDRADKSGHGQRPGRIFAGEKQAAEKKDQDLRKKTEKACDVEIYFCQIEERRKQCVKETRTKGKGGAVKAKEIKGDNRNHKKSKEVRNQIPPLEEVHF